MTKDSYDGGFTVLYLFCNEPFTVYSPTPEYIRIIKHPCEREDSITRDRNCPTCSQSNKIIWDKDHNLWWQWQTKCDQEKIIGIGTYNALFLRSIKIVMVTGGKRV